MSLAEKATTTFYEWDSFLRGYYFFEYPVELEPPFIRASYLPNITEQPKIDDGKVPSIFSKLKTAFTQSPNQEEEQEYNRTPKTAKYGFQLRALNIPLNYTETIHIKSAREFLFLLSSSLVPFSFEIIGKGSKIHIQLVCSDRDFERVKSLAELFFDNIRFGEINTDLDIELYEEDAVILDFGLEEEAVRPIKEAQDLVLDPLTPFFSTFKSLKENELCMLQIIFKGVKNAWSRELLNAVSDGQGGSFFGDAPEMPKLAQIKTNSPLYGVIVRLAVQGLSKVRTEQIAEDAIYNIKSISRSETNQLIPISNDGYEFANHFFNLRNRTSHRLGMLLNANELLSFVHFPHPNLLKGQMDTGNRKTKRVPSICQDKKYHVGYNIHEGEELEVSYDDESKLRHTHLIGATGTGKSSYIVSQLIEDVTHDAGTMLIDPHGDVVDDIIARIPQERLSDVVVIDPSDMDFPIGFNLLEANTEQEKLLLSSDLVDIFKREATSWGDVMTSVLSNTINAFVESDRGGTLFELKSFLLDEDFRNEFLETVQDPITKHYFIREFPSIRRSSLSPVLTRLDNFLRPKVLRNMFIQKQGINFHELIAQNKIVLCKLGVGLIGQRNASFLGSLLIAKINQAAFARQSIAKDDRTPYMLYIDEVHNTITDSIDALLSGARKYSLGCVLAHQNLSQLKNKSEYIMQSILNNAYIRICFRTSEQDSSVLARGFSTFEAEDIMSQEIGQAYARVGSSSNDFSLELRKLDKVSKEKLNVRKEAIIEQTRKQYGASIDEINLLIKELYPNKAPKTTHKKKDITVAPKEKIEKKTVTTESEVINKVEQKIEESKTDLEKQAQEFIKQEERKEGNKEHILLQTLVRKLAHDRGFKVEIEKTLEGGGRVDVHLQNENISIACEISVTNKAEYEVKNIIKCLNEGYDLVLSISQNSIHLENIATSAKNELSKPELKKVQFIDPQYVSAVLDEYVLQNNKEKIVRGYRVKVTRKK